MYSEKFTNEIINVIEAIATKRKNNYYYSYDFKTMRNIVSRYEELVPELRGYSFDFSEDSFSKLCSLISFMMRSLDPAPALKTKFIKNYISSEKLNEYAGMLKGSFEENASSLEVACPSLIRKFKDFSKKIFQKEETKIKYKFAIILAAQEKCINNGKISMSKALRDFLKKFSETELDNIVFKEFKNYIPSINKAFAWICEHEMDILKELAFCVSKEEILDLVISNLFPDLLPDFIKDMIRLSESSHIKYTIAYDEYLEGQVNDLVVEYVKYLENLFNDSDETDKEI